ncbi:zinc finger protein [Aaosphaeria arxii CBS 175.79]|uniref:Zinc finger protein n=1 Tax=Aaosphaeria arxii CBS 175.79 TaxID=1450172 RepID=A0A6A5X6J1_9PLEO|nr:zinc finger protein [Aaosphaeria arxii CBS 175.79]KAF2008486.1 zinc finger protein [Aaosphaeria arxii CBS 175.79]
MNALDHWGERYECETCDREFFTQESANQHMNALDHWDRRFECETCDRTFHTEQSANQHMDDTNHWQPEFECDTCDRAFYTQQSADQHMNDKNHWKPQFECDTCDRAFHTQTSADQHMSALNHFRQYHCSDCSRSFQDENALKMHLNSSLHRGKNIVCPFCKVAKASTSSLSHHLETGSCPRAKDVNHHTLFHAISQRDPNGLVTNKLLTYTDSNVQNIATSASWNGRSYECYLCHREHGSLGALNQHLNSLVHREKLYHCPNRNCTRDFVGLASLFNHLESESCGFVRFEKVQQKVHSFITGGQKLISFA